MARKKLLPFALGGGSAVANLVSKEYICKMWKKFLVSHPYQTSSCPGVFPYSTGREDFVLAAGLIDTSSPMTDC